MKNRQVFRLYPLPQNQQHTAKSELEQLLIKYLGEIPYGGSDTFSANPVVMGQTQFAQLERLTVILAKAFQCIVEHYFDDIRIKNIYRLDNELEDILRLAYTKPYQIGAFRPDFLHDTSGQLKICEIGARYPLNGWMLSYYANLIVQEANFCSNELIPIPHQTQFLTDLQDFFASDAPITLLHDTEKGTEVFNFLAELAKQGMSWIDAKPQDIVLEEGQLWAFGKSVSQFILEMDREELRKFKPEVLAHLIENCRYFNDIRTLILIHDKKVLAVLFDKDIMQDYLTQEEYAFLLPYLIPTYSLNEETFRKSLLTTDENWVLKQCSGGRGVGMYVKESCDKAVWQEVLNNQWQSYMVQKYIKQAFFEYHDQPIHIVGLFLCFNDAFYGIGIYRGSQEQIINVHQSRGLIFLCALPANSSPD